MCCQIKSLLFKLLLSITGCASEVTIQETVALHNAASFGKLDTIKELIESGVLVDTLDVHGFTPLLHALRPHLYRSDENIPVVRYLLEKGACPRLPPPLKKRSNGVYLGPEEGPLAVASRRDVPELCELLLLHKANPQERMARSGESVLEFVKQRQRDYHGYSDNPLLGKIYNKITQMRVMLEEAGAR